MQALLSATSRQPHVRIVHAFAPKRIYYVPCTLKYLYGRNYLLWRKQSRKWARRSVVALAEHEPDLSERTIKSIDDILGSEDTPGNTSSIDTEENNAESKRRRPLPEAGPKRVRPVYVYVIYYCYIVVYLAAAWLQATEGDLSASALTDALVNDHLAVASGQVPRLATCSFVTDNPLELFLQLATLATVGAEAEALLGHSLFWAVYWLAGLGGALADAALSELPVTYGPADAAAGIVGGLVAYYVRNVGLEAKVEAAREEARAAKRRGLMGGGGAGRRGAGGGGGEEGRGERSDGRRSRDTKQRPPDRTSLDDDEETETEVEFLPMLSFKWRTRLGPEGRGLLNVLVATVLAGQGLLDFGDASSSSSWIGLVAAFWTGLSLTYGAGPQYQVVHVSPPQQTSAESGWQGGREGERMTAATGSSQRQQQQDKRLGQQQVDVKQEQWRGTSVKTAAKWEDDTLHESGGGGGGGGSSGVEARDEDAAAGDMTPTKGVTDGGKRRAKEAAAAVADVDGLLVVDVCPMSRRQAVLGSYVVGLAAAICCWLIWMGTDL